MKKLITIVFAVLTISAVVTGCSLQSRIGSAANTVVSNYCTKTPTDRAVVRMWMDAATTPNQIRVNCAVDTVNQAQSVSQ